MWGADVLRLHRSGSIPVLFVFGRAPVDAEAFRSVFESTFGKGESPTKRVYVYVHTRYAHAVACLRSAMSKSSFRERVSIAEVGPGGHCFASGAGPKNGDSIVFMGDSDESPLLVSLMLSHNQSSVFRFDPAKNQISEARSASRTLSRRFYLMSAVKEAKIIGIVAGTMSVGRYLDVIRHVERVIRDAGKKSYLFLVGKINAPKLANFAEVDAFVLVACPFQVRIHFILFHFILLFPPF